MTRDTQTFITEATTLASPPLVSELKLHLATDAVALWQMTEAELAHANAPPPFWAFAWAGGQALARYVIDTPIVVAGKRVLDVAAGGGIAGLAALWASAAHVTANEIDPFAWSAISMNARVNRLTLGLEILDRDILGEPVLTEDGRPRWDVILAGDVCYERGMATRMVDWLRRHSAAGVLVLVGDPGRSYMPRHGVTDLARYSVPTPLALEDREFRETVVLQVL